MWNLSKLSGLSGNPKSQYIRGTIDTHPLPYKDVVDDGATTENNSETNDDGCHYSRCLVEMQEGEENDSWQKKW